MGFLGPNGEGKTVTVGMMTGLAKPTSSFIVIEDLDAARSGIRTFS